MGVIYSYIGKLDKAIDYYKQALEFDSKHLDALVNLAIAFIYQGKFKQAITNLEKAIAVNPNHSDIWFYLGNCVKSIGDLERAISCYERAVKINPNDFKPIVPPKIVSDNITIDPDGVISIK